MKRKTWIILGGAYLALVAVILVVALLVKDESPETALEPTGTTVAEIGTDDPTQTPPEAVTEAMDEAYPLVGEMSTNVDLLQTGYPDIDEVMTPTQAVSGSAPTLTRTPTSSGAFVSTQMPTATSGTGASPVPTSTRTATPTHTSAPQTGWEGEWVVWLEQEDGTYATGNMTVWVLDDTISSEGEIDGLFTSFSGELFYGDRYAGGEWSQGDDTASFFWDHFERDFIGGNLNSELGFCASRNDQTQPDPCFLLPQEE